MMEYACKDLVFHFNKKHLEDESIPMWVVKTRGETFYVDHVSATSPWSTKETPNNSHTKGSIKFKKCLLTIDDNNNATIGELTEEIENRLKKNEDRCRVITRHQFFLKKALSQLSLEHDKIVTIGGYCSTPFYVVDIAGKKNVSLLAMLVKDLRILNPNEDYYRWYSEAIDAGVTSHLAEDDELDSPEDDDEG